MLEPATATSEVRFRHSGGTVLKIVNWRVERTRRNDTYLFDFRQPSGFS